MGKYGQAALDAVALLTRGKALDPADAWSKATSIMFGKGASSQKKSCPRNAFLGLCDAGLVKGILPGNSTTSIDNSSYAVAGAHLLRANPGMRVVGANVLWNRIM